MAVIAIDAEPTRRLCSRFYVSEREKSHKMGVSAEQRRPTLVPLAHAGDVVFLGRRPRLDGQFPWRVGEPPAPIIG